MEREDQISAIQDAQEKLYEAIEILASVAKARDDSHADSYLIAPLKIHTSDNHNYLTRDFNCDKWIHEIQDEIDNICPKCCEREGDCLCFEEDTE